MDGEATRDEGGYSSSTDRDSSRTGRIAAQRPLSRARGRASDGLGPWGPDKRPSRGAGDVGMSVALFQSMESSGADLENAVPETDPKTDLEFWRRFLAEQDLLLGMCVRWLSGHRQDAEDAVSGGALRALAFYRRHPGKVENFRPWMLRVLYNLCVDIRKARDRLTGLPRGEDEDEPNLLAVDSAAMPERAVYAREIRQVLRDEVAGLPDWLHAVFRQRIVDEIEYPEICRRFRISPENARQRILLARRQLQSRLAAFR